MKLSGCFGLFIDIPFHVSFVVLVLQIFCLCIKSIYGRKYKNREANTDYMNEKQPAEKKITCLFQFSYMYLSLSVYYEKFMVLMISFISFYRLIKNETGRAILRVISGSRAFKVVLFARLTPIPFGLQNTIFGVSFKTFFILIIII